MAILFEPSGLGFKKADLVPEYPWQFASCDTVNDSFVALAFSSSEIFYVMAPVFGDQDFGDCAAATHRRLSNLLGAEFSDT